MNPTIKDRPSPVRPAGDGKGAWLAALEQGANLLQDTTPLKGLGVSGPSRKPNVYQEGRGSAWARWRSRPQ